MHELYDDVRFTIVMIFSLLQHCSFYLGDHFVQWMTFLKLPKCSDFIPHNAKA